jgi:hypothetical protein
MENYRTLISHINSRTSWRIIECLFHTSILEHRGELSNAYFTHQFHVEHHGELSNAYFTHQFYVEHHGEFSNLW